MKFEQPVDELLYDHLSRSKQGGHEITASHIARHSGYSVSTVRKSMHRLVLARLVVCRLGKDKGHACWLYRRVK